MSRLEELERQKNAILAEQSRCQHRWNDPIYDPETVQEGYGYKAVGRGSDVWGEYEGYRPVQKPRWSRTCSKCEKKEYTFEEGTKVVKTGPKFN